MYIGETLKERMDMLGFDMQALSDESLLSTGFIQQLLSNQIEMQNVDPFTLETLANALYCTSDYFISADAKQNDVVFCSQNRGVDTSKSNLAKAKMQQFVRDLLFIKNTIE